MLRAVSRRVPSVPLSAYRAFHTSNVRHTNAFFTGASKDSYYMKKPLDEVAKMPPMEPGLLNKWGGVAPFFAALGAIGITKEIMLIDAELLLGLSMSLVYVGIYVAIGDTTKKAIKGGYDNIVSWFHDMHDAAIAGCGFYKAEQKAKLDAEACWQQYLTEYQTVMTSYAEAMAVKPQHVARDKVLATLEAIRGREKLQAASKWRNFIVAYEASVREILADPELQSDIFESTIKLIGKEENMEEGALLQSRLGEVLELALMNLDPALLEDEPAGEGFATDEDEAWQFAKEEGEDSPEGQAVALKELEEAEAALKAAEEAESDAEDGEKQGPN